MTIRRYTPTDCESVASLFYNTVHTVNVEDYSQEQLNVWATGNMDLAVWNKSLSKHYTVVAVENDRIVGFGDMDKTGYLDRLYVHKDYQRRGIATAICNELEKSVKTSKITTHSSITAKPFFMQRGFTIVKEQQVIRNGIALTNYIMEKQIRSSLRGTKRQSNPEEAKYKMTKSSGLLRHKCLAMTRNVTINALQC